MIGGKSRLAQCFYNLRKSVSSSVAPLPASKHRNNQPGSIRAAVSAESFGDEGDAASIADDVLETQGEHERFHPQDEWSC